MISRRALVAALTVALAVLAATAPPRARAQDEPYLEPSAVESGGLLTCVVGAGRLVTLPEQIERVALADESLARIQIISVRELLLTGLKPGRTTLFVWLVDGRRMRFTLQADPELDLVRKLVQDLDPGIFVETSGDSVVLRGEVAEAAVAREALARARTLLPNTRLIDLIRSPDREAEADSTADERLAAALWEVDPRIQVRRIQVGQDPETAADTYLLEGRVRNVAALVRAMTVAERQLGGSGVGVVPVGGGPGLAAGGFAGALTPGLASQISRGLVMSTPSGQVLSFLEVDELPQILVAIRVLEVDRTKAKSAGINFSFDDDRFSVVSATGLQGLADGNLNISFVDQVTSITAAIDYLETLDVLRTVAEPNILTLAGEQASLVIGGQLPIPTTTVNQTTTVQSFQFQEFGVRMNIRPTLVEGDVITLEVSPSVTRTLSALSFQGVPGFSFQNVQTTARVHAGQSLVLGGLLDFGESEGERRVPGLGWLPLFRWKSKTRRERELLFVITPRLVEIDPAEPAAPIPPVDGERIELPPVEWPELRDSWKDEFEPRTLTPEGVPPEFLQPREDPSGRELESEAKAFEPLPEVDLTEPEDAFESEDPQLDVDVVGSKARERSAAAAAEELERTRLEAPAAPQVWKVTSRIFPCLNFRAEAGMWRAPMACLPPGRLATQLSSTDGWTKVRLFDGREGWLATRFLEPAAPGPHAEGVVEPVAALARLDEAAEVVTAWAQAWSEQRAEDHLSFYSRDFRPGDGSGRSEWESLRRARIASPEFVRVDLGAIDARPVDDDRVAVSFTQSYESDLLRRTVSKRMELVWEDGAWKIAKEIVERSESEPAFGD